MKTNDNSILVDVLKVLVTKRDLFSMEICATIFPMLRDLLYSHHEEYVATGLSIIKQLIKNVVLMIKSTREGQARGGNSVTEKRLEQCSICNDTLLDVKDQLGALKKRYVRGFLLCTAPMVKTHEH